MHISVKLTQTILEILTMFNVCCMNYLEIITHACKTLCSLYFINYAVRMAHM